MLKHIDRLMIQGYFKSYAVCLISLLSLYIVVDLFTNLDEFTSKHHSISGIVHHVSYYYGNHVALIFDRLCEAIVLLAGMFTIAWMQRNNELLPLLSAAPRKVGPATSAAPAAAPVWRKVRLRMVFSLVLPPGTARHSTRDRRARKALRAGGPGGSRAGRMFRRGRTFRAGDLTRLGT